MISQAFLNGMRASAGMQNIRNSDQRSDDQNMTVSGNPNTIYNMPIRRRPAGGTVATAPATIPVQQPFSNLAQYGQYVMPSKPVLVNPPMGRSNLAQGGYAQMANQYGPSGQADMSPLQQALSQYGAAGGRSNMAPAQQATAQVPYPQARNNLAQGGQYVMPSEPAQVQQSNYAALKAQLAQQQQGYDNVQPRTIPGYRSAFIGNQMA